MDTSAKSPRVCNQDYDEDVMKQMEDLIAEKNKMDTEGPSEWEDIPQVKPASQIPIGVEPAQAVPDKNHGANVGRQNTFRLHTRQESPASTVSQEPIVRLTQSAWDSMMGQIVKLKKDKMEALVKVAAMERDEEVRRQAKGDNSSELDQLRYRLEVNRDLKAAMSRDIRQKDAELCQMQIENDDLKEQVAVVDAMRKQLEKLHAELDFVRAEAVEATEASKQSEANAGSYAQLIELKDQEIQHLKEELASLKRESKRLRDEAASTDFKLTGHQTRADNLADTQAVRERKL